jgi:dephospho-CoA kinase
MERTARRSVPATMKTLGLSGGMASGKSLVSRQLADLGALALDADRAGHEALRLPEIEAAARQRWGNAIFDGEGHIDRSKLARIVFAPPPDGPRERKYLEALTHPEIGRRLAAQIDAAKGVAPLAVLDAALLFEAGWDRLCNSMVFVDAPRAARLARALQRGWTEEDFAAREAAQDSLESKRARADWIIDNSGPIAHTQSQVKRLWQSLVG